MTKIATAALLFVLPASAQAPVTIDSTAFALALHRAVAGNENVMTSPYSLRQALGMAYVGSAGKTRAEMARVLGAGESFESDERALRRSLAAANGPATLKVANALFVKKGYALLPRFLETVKRAFDAEVFVRAFGPAAVAEINAWANTATNGKIRAILGKLDDRDSALLLNAVYFKGRWATAFPKNKSDGGRHGGAVGGPLEEIFRPGTGKPFSLKLMSVWEDFAYAEAPGWQAVRLPYKGGRLAMIVVLPAADSSLAAFRATLDAASWQRLRAQRFRASRGLVAIPRFKFEQSHAMIDPLARMGMTRPFDRLDADFSNMSQPADAAEKLYISDVMQKTFVEVNEEGTEAAAVTYSMLASRGAGPRHDPPPFRFVANRPFLFAIEEIQSGTILFIGEVQDPR